MKQIRWKSKIVWISILALFLTFFGNWGLYDAIGITLEPLQHAIDCLLVLLITIGIFNNPTDRDNF